MRRMRQRVSTVFTFLGLFGLAVFFAHEGGVQGIGFALYLLFFAAFGVVMMVTKRTRGTKKTVREKKQEWMGDVQGRLARGELTWEEADAEWWQLEREGEAEIDAWPMLQKWLAYAVIGVAFALTLIGVDTGTPRRYFLAAVVFWAVVIFVLRQRQRDQAKQRPRLPSS